MGLAGFESETSASEVWYGNIEKGGPFLIFQYVSAADFQKTFHFVQKRSLAYIVTFIVNKYTENLKVNTFLFNFKTPTKPIFS